MVNQSSVKQALKVDIAISPPMAEALHLWSQMYANQAPWLSEDIHSLNLPAAIASEIARAVTIEAKIEISGSARADFLAIQFAPIIDRLREQIEKGCAKGGLIMKPYVDGKRIVVDFVQADMFYPVTFDNNGNIVACVFADQRTIGDKYYTRLELHQMTEQGCEIKNMAFRSTTRDTLGQPVELSTVDAWANLLPEATVTNVDRPLFSYFKYPLANNIDPTSPLGISCYSRAVDLIKDADVQWSNLLWEFESGQRALYVDLLAFGKDKDGKPQLPNKRLYRQIDGGGQDDALFEDWTPNLREENILRGLDAILKRIEFQCGLAYGTLSDPQTVDKTATEIKISRQRTYATITDTQKVLQIALDDLLYAMDVWVTLTNLAPRGTYSVTYMWDDSVVVDKDVQFQQDMRLVQSGLMSKTEFRMRNMGEDETTAKKKIAEAQTEQPQEADLFQGS